MASSDFVRMLSVGAIRFEDRFCLAKKAGQREVGGFQHGVLCTWQLPWLAVEKLVGTGWIISHFVNTNRLRNHSPPLVGVPFLDL